MTTFFPLNPSTALPPALILSLPSCLCCPASLHEPHSYNQTNAPVDSSASWWMRAHFQPHALPTYHPSEGSRLFQFRRATSDRVWWQIWEARGGSVWLRDEKSAVIQEPSVILPSKEHGLHPPGFQPLPAHMANEEWQSLAVSVFLVFFISFFFFFLMLSWSPRMSVLASLCLLAVFFLASDIGDIATCVSCICYSIQATYKACCFTACSCH